MPKSPNAPNSPKPSNPTLFHNPQCSKSRGAKEILDAEGIDYRVVEYITAPPSRAEIERIVDRIDDEPAALVRTKDPKFKALGLAAGDYRDKASVVALLIEHPQLMERPVVVMGDRAVIARPPERVKELWR